MHVTRKYAFLNLSYNKCHNLHKIPKPEYKVLLKSGLQNEFRDIGFFGSFFWWKLWMLICITEVHKIFKISHVWFKQKNDKIDKTETQERNHPAQFQILELSFFSLLLREDSVISLKLNYNIKDIFSNQLMRTCK